MNSTHPFAALRNTPLLALCLFIAAILSLANGQAFFWDVPNYHIYIPYAFLTGRLGVDIIPAGIHTFFNPVADIPYWLMLKYINDFPRLAAVLQSVWLGTAFFFIIKISRLIMKGENFIISAVLPCMLFFFSPATYGWAFSNTADMMTASFILGSLYIALRAPLLQKNSTRYLAFAIAGFLLGAGFFLKYTNAPFVAGYIFMLLFLSGSFKNFVKNCLCAAAGALTAALLFSGVWFYKMYSMFGNPLFPFYNNIFHSAWFEEIALIDMRFLDGKSLLEQFALPVTSLFYQSMSIIESDMRTATIFASWVACLILLWSVFYKKIKLPFDKKPFIALIVFFIFSYALWLKTFSLIRYTMPIEAAGALLIVFLVTLLPKCKYRYFLIVFLCCAVAFYTQIPRDGSAFFGKRIIQINTLKMPPPLEKQKNWQAPALPGSSSYPQVESGAVVILSGHRLSFLIPFMNADAVYLSGLAPDANSYSGIESKIDILHEASFSRVFYKHKFEPLIKEKIKEAQHLYVLIYSDAPETFFKNGLLHYGVRINTQNCQLIITNVTAPIWLCPAEKL